MFVAERELFAPGLRRRLHNNPLIRFVMRRIARQEGAPTDTSHDYEYTDWGAIERFADRLARELAASSPLAPQPSL